MWTLCVPESRPYQILRQSVSKIRSCPRNVDNNLSGTRGNWRSTQSLIQAESQSKKPCCGSDKDAIRLWFLRHYLDPGNQQRLYDDAPHLLENSNLILITNRLALGLPATTLLLTLSKRRCDGNGYAQNDFNDTHQRIDPDEPLAWIGEVAGHDVENIRLLLVAFLSGLSGDNIW